jgi:arylsulfatase A-like enzyme
MTKQGAGRAALAVVALFAIAGLLVAPANATRQQLFRQPCAVGPWVLATVLWPAAMPHAPVIVPPSPWLLDRSHAPAIPPTAPPPLPSNPVIVLITIDALRAEALDDPSHASLVPTFNAMKRDGVVFTRATTPGAQTPTSLAALFSGRYFSEQKWDDYGEGGDRFPYPAGDPAPRFPEILSAHGVTTVQDAAFVFLVNRFGVLRGFSEEKMLGHTRNACPARYVISPLIDRLSHAKDEPMFLYTHLGEPHAPYVYGRPGAPVRERYFAAIAEADTQVGRVLRHLKEHFENRWVLIVSADHGEAFGEHQTTDHSKTLYEELLHVPLLVESPAFTPRRVDERVGLIDVGPTILDLFGVDTPATFNGQSLVPILAGGSVTLTRPLIAEGRLAKEYTQQDGFKVIDDPRRKVVEAYDLRSDPLELRNVFDAEPTRADAALGFLRAFYAAHALREAGYEPPYKP